jgi:VIT1/CCC1 family predicted Fe2+/Mn2+ transporter
MKKYRQHLQTEVDASFLARNAIAGKSADTLSGGEMNHVQILNNLSASSEGMKGGLLARLENRHRSMGGNALRAAVLGANDGLVTNLSLIMGVAGAAGDHDAIVIAGVAGLLAGAISMALGEWLSVQSSRELNQRQIDIETTELENSPEEEELELTLIYQSKGVPKEQAEEMASAVLQNKETAVETLVREELGLDSQELGGSAWEAAITSFILFAIGAILPLIPFLFLQSYYPVWISLGLSIAGLFILGAAITFYTGKSLWYSGFRQILFGLAAAGITYGIGKLIGISLL